MVVGEPAIAAGLFLGSLPQCYLPRERLFFVAAVFFVAVLPRVLVLLAVPAVFFVPAICISPELNVIGTANHNVTLYLREIQALACAVCSVQRIDWARIPSSALAVERRTTAIHVEQIPADVSSLRDISTGQE